MPLDAIILGRLGTQEAQDAFLSEAFATRKPMIIASAVQTVKEARAVARIPDDPQWEDTLALFGNPDGAARMLAGIAEAEASLGPDEVFLGPGDILDR